ncbi:hypothetical protein GALL_216280 [mine drainage metagenome]|uniref:Uncharacterized protein n=1 Tax=mine drainage metagenome TaxID=410659 RepID=A0A1J5RWI2_9ZZZZ
MVKSSKYTWSYLFDFSNIIMRRMIALGLQADRILEGRSNGVLSERICRQRLLDIAQGTELESQVQDVLAEWQEFPQKMPEFLKKQMRRILNVIPSKDVDIPGLIKLTSEVGAILEIALTVENFSNIKQLKMMADTGKLYFEFVKKIIFWFERDLHARLMKGELTARLSDPLPESVIYKVKQFELIACVLGYAGICLVLYASKVINKLPRKWCQICFRRTSPFWKYCNLHATGNKNINEFRFGKKIHAVLLKRKPYLIQKWRQNKKYITEIEEQEREFSGSLDSSLTNWKQPMLKFINRSPSLEKRVSIDYIQSIDNWIETVQYLRVKFENRQEKSYDIQAVLYWLEMARDWFEIEDIFRSSNGDRLKSSKKSATKLPTATLIADLCEQEPGIIKSEIARRIGKSPTTVGRCVKKYKELQKYFD